MQQAKSMLWTLIRRLSLRTVLTVPFVTIVVLTVGLTGYLAFENGQSAVNDLAGQLQRQVTARIQQHLDSYLATPLLVNQLNLDDIRLGHIDPQNVTNLKRPFLNDLERFPSVVSIAYANEQKEYAGPTRNVMGVERGWAISGPSTSYTLNGYRLDSQGNQGELVYSVPDYDPRPRPWYQAAVQAGKQTWTPIFMWPSGDVGLDAVAPVYDQNGKLLGVLDTS
ncbi:MAG: cache domain-containing protein, partial [Anaerolineae bacterium]